MRLSARRRKALASSQEREEELAAGAALVHYTGLVVAFGSTRAELEDATAEVIAAAATCRLRLWLLYGRPAAALGAALPLARKVAPRSGSAEDAAVVEIGAHVDGGGGTP